MPYQDSVPVIPGIFHLTLVRNSGIAFGLFRNHHGILFALISISLVILFFWGSTLKHHSVGARWGFGFIVGGAIGNWIDRVRVGAVIDFLDFRIWPVFNIADFAITLGVGLYLFSLLKTKKGVNPDA